MNSREVFTQPLASSECHPYSVVWACPNSCLGHWEPSLFFPADPAFFGVPWGLEAQKGTVGKEEKNIS